MMKNMHKGKYCCSVFGFMVGMKEFVESGMSLYKYVIELDEKRAMILKYCPFCGEKL